MTFPTASENRAQAHIRNTSRSIHRASLTQSRETGDVLPSSGFNEELVTRKEAPEVKPWAHFVAGGYCILENTQAELSPGFPC